MCGKSFVRGSCSWFSIIQGTARRAFPRSFDRRFGSGDAKVGGHEQRSIPPVRLILHPFSIFLN